MSPEGRNAKVLWAAVAVILAAGLAAGVYYFYFRAPHPKKSIYAGTTVNKVLAAQNPDFVSGVSFIQSADFKDALASFEKALPNAHDSSQQGLIEFYIGLMNERLGNYSVAIDDYKAVGANAKYYPLIRAYAVQEIGLMHHTYYGADAVPAIIQATFTGDPYASFKQGSNYEASYLKLFQYAAGIYPLATAESYVAYGYAKDLQGLQGATTTAAGQSDVLQIAAALRAAKADLPRLMANPYEASYAPDTLSREATAEWYLVAYGVPGYSDSEIESLYMRSMGLLSAAGGKPGSFIAWKYAVFLDRAYGKSRAADILKLLAPFSVSSVDKIDPLVAVFLKQLPSNTAMAQERELTKLLGELDPDFKSYLISLGWHASDFSSH